MVGAGQEYGRLHKGHAAPGSPNSSTMATQSSQIPTVHRPTTSLGAAVALMFCMTGCQVDWRELGIPHAHFKGASAFPRRYGIKIPEIFRPTFGP